MEVAGKRFCSHVLKIASQRSAGVFSQSLHHGQHPLGQTTAGAEQEPRSQPHRNRTELDFAELSDLMTFGDDIALIDVRSPNELATYGSIPGAVNIPLSEVKSALQLSAPAFLSTFLVRKPSSPGRDIVFFARGPNAASAAVEIAHKLGFKSSRQYTGGWEDYCKMTGVPLKKPEYVGHKTGSDANSGFINSSAGNYYYFSV